MRAPNLYRLAIALLITAVLLLSGVSLYQQGKLKDIEDALDIAITEKMALQAKLQEAEARNDVPRTPKMSPDKRAQTTWPLATRFKSYRGWDRATASDVLTELRNDLQWEQAENRRLHIENAALSAKLDDTIRAHDQRVLERDRLRAENADLKDENERKAGR